MPKITAQLLRDLVGEVISESIDMHRSSRKAVDPFPYNPPVGDPTEDEISDFIASNPWLDEETRARLLDPGLLGFHNAEGVASKDAWAEFQTNVALWHNNLSWLGAELPWLTEVDLPVATESRIWRPSTELRPDWISRSPTALLMAVDVLKSGRFLSELPWRAFEEVLGQLLEAEDWKVEVTRASKDGGIDVVATKNDPTVGSVRSLWQAKRYGPARYVRLSDVRELSAVLERARATKGVIVTTGRLTRGSLDWIRSDQYRLDYKDAHKMEAWIRSKFLI